MRQMLKQALLVFMIAALPALLWAQVPVSGTITDASGKPVPGASIRVKNSNLGTSTDANGKFSFTVPGKGGTLEISAISFKSQTIEVSAASAGLSIQLVEDVGKLDEVIVTGLATSVKRRNLANAVATISNKELTGGAPAQTLDAAMNGKITGAYINANSGAPGGGISIKLRGVTSVFGNTQPLFVVDGVFVDNTATPAGLNTVTAAARGGSSSNQDNPSSRIADLRAEDIENIEILKGASAAAIYGSKAAAGVVLITTRRGKPGQTKVSFAQDLGFVKIRKFLGARTWTAERAEALGGSDAATRAARKQEFLDAQAAGKIYDYEQEMYGEKGFTRNSALSVSGGGERTSFYFSAFQKDEEGIVQRTGYRNSGLRLNIDHRLSDNVKIGVTANYINSSADRALTNNDNNSVTLGVALSSTPSFTELHPDQFGNYPRNKYSASNPIETRDQVTNNEAVDRFVTGVNVDAIFQKSAKSTTRFIGRGGIDFYSLKTTALFPSSLQFQQVAEGTNVQGFTRSLNANYIVSLVNNFIASPSLNFTTSAGITQEQGDYNNLINVATKTVANQTNVDQGSALTAQQLRNKYQDNGIFVQEEVGIIDAITLTAGVRFDKSTNNGDPNKYYAYPKAAFSWNLTNSVIENSFFDNLKVRAAYGQAGNFPAFGSKFTLMNIFNIGGTTGLLVSTLRGSPNIQPERTSEMEAGVDFSVLKSRVNFEISFYEKRIKDFLLQRPVAGSTGFSTEWVNAGDLRNRGIEIGVNAQPIVNKNVRWNTNLNFWLNRSKITKLNIDPVVLGVFGNTLGTFKIEEGKPATQIVGIDGAAGVVQLGDAEPRFQMNWFNELTFLKGFSLRWLFHWKEKGDVINLSELLTDLGSTSPDYDDLNKDGKASGPARIANVGVSARQFVQDAGYLRLREVALYYTFPKLPVNFVKGLRVGVSANNYFTSTNYKNYDPEVSNFGTGFSTGVDVMPFPSSKRATFHLLVDF
ncbi:SusC/RagA family TonB-linked outer membrane protein [Paraflavitalea sp. CAU 1676]|uniref:SusC/RagA family TonB-linked outer membrane protein n=1 Tax=Paraflavitalea sp. CAU 1676 TaxID=3032598 RepID=UPI0023DB2B66|nr:SusC/RagA family TonB-linked outer membrane protein [Paraflavitalea sp. CAU 1676]MDF2187415.1 SusC/RagA family TonB-linked outer membrane protein [Paraflavitalea sp. CAU 1676]